MAHSKAWIAIGGLALMILIAGKVLSVILLTALAPLYALVLSSVFLIVFVALATIIASVGQSLLENRQERTRRTHRKDESIKTGRFRDAA